MPEIVDVAASMEKDARPEWRRLNRLTRYSRGKQKLPWLPDNVEAEYRELALKSATNWLDLTLRALTQGMRADGWGDPDGEQPRAWVDGWLANGMDARQESFYRAVAVHGYGFLFHLPSDGGGVWMRPDSADNVHAVWGDDDEYPERVLRVVEPKKRWEVWDDTARHVLVANGRMWRVASSTPHGQDRCPVVRVQHSFDLTGPPRGEIEPVIPVQDRIVDATFTLQMVAKYGAFPQRWIAGLNPGEPLRDADGEILRDADGQPLMPRIQAYVDAILTAADPDTKFGSFAAADLGAYVQALEAHIRHLAAVTQTPPHYLLGSLVNLSAEALAAAEAGLLRRQHEVRVVVAEGLEQSLRVVSSMLGDDVMASDLRAAVHWADIESRSLSQTADALLKLGQLGVPLPKLLQMIPGWTSTDVQEAVEAARVGSLEDTLSRLVDQAQPEPVESALVP